MTSSMFWTPWRAAATAAVIAGITLSSIPADACSCRPPTSPTAARDAVDAVFEGRAEASSVAKSAGPGLSPTGLSIPFTVIRAFKGVEASGQVTVTTSGNPASCGYPFAAGETYLVYAWREKNGSLGTGLCSRTRRSAEAADDFAAFAAPAGAGSAAPGAGGSAAVAPSTPPSTSTGNSNAAPGNTTGTTEPAPAGAGAPSGISVEPAGAPPPSEPQGGGCAGCALNSADHDRGAPELAALLGLAALGVRIARRRR
jgi:hypothetical protein